MSAVFIIRILDILRARPVYKILSVGAQSKTIAIIRGFRISVCSFQVNGKLDLQVFLGYKRQVRIPILICREDQIIMDTFRKGKKMRE